MKSWVSLWKLRDTYPGKVPSSGLHSCPSYRFQLLLIDQRHALTQFNLMTVVGLGSIENFYQLSCAWLVLRLLCVSCVCIFVYLYICVSPLITCTIITLHTLLPCDLSWLWQFTWIYVATMSSLAQIQFEMDTEKQRQRGSEDDREWKRWKWVVTWDAYSCQPTENGFQESSWVKGLAVFRYEITVS